MGVARAALLTAVSRADLIDVGAFACDASVVLLAAAVAGAAMAGVLAALEAAGALVRLAVPAVAALALYAVLVRLAVPEPSRALITTVRAALRRACARAAARTGSRRRRSSSARPLQPHPDGPRAG